MPDYLNKIVYLSQSDYETLVANQTLTKNNQTITYNLNDLYVTPEVRHSLTFGNGTYVYDGSADVTVPVYTGGY